MDERIYTGGGTIEVVPVCRFLLAKMIVAVFFMNPWIGNRLFFKRVLSDSMKTSLTSSSFAVIDSYLAAPGSGMLMMITHSDV